MVITQHTKRGTRKSIHPETTYYSGDAKRTS